MVGWYKVYFFLIVGFYEKLKDFLREEIGRGCRLVFFDML